MEIKKIKNLILQEKRKHPNIKETKTFYNWRDMGWTYFIFIGYDNNVEGRIYTDGYKFQTIEYPYVTNPKLNKELWEIIKKGPIWDHINVMYPDVNSDIKTGKFAQEIGKQGNLYGVLVSEFWNWRTGGRYISDWKDYGSYEELEKE